MAQLDVTQYKRLTGNMVYGQSDGMYWDNTNSQLVVVMGDAIVARIDATGIEADLEVSGEARGDLLIRGASAWGRVSCKGDGYILIGDGTDVKSVASSGDVVIANTGAATIQAGSLDTGMFAAQAVDTAALKDANVTDGKLAFRAMSDEGAQAVGYVDFTGVTSDTETVTINSRVYEFDTDSTSTGDVAVDISGGNSAAQSATALAAAINADGSRDVDAIDVGDGTVLLTAESAGGTNFTLAETCANGTVSAATMVGAAAAALQAGHAHARTITAADVTNTTDANGVIPICGVPSTSTPTKWLLDWKTSAGVTVSSANVQWTWVQANSNFYVLQALETQGAATDFTANDVVTVLVIE